MIVFDASIIIKWFRDEDNSEAAFLLKDKHIRGEDVIAVPDLLFYEIVNVLRYQKSINENDLDGILDILIEMEVHIFTVSPHEFKEVFRFARTHEISVYDAAYVVLAQKLNCAFVTADKKLYRKLKDFPRVNLL